MGDKVDKFCIFNVNDDVNHRAFSIDFEAYNYFVMTREDLDAILYLVKN